MDGQARVYSGGAGNRSNQESGGRIRSSADAALRKTLQGRMQPFRASNFPHDSAERFEC